jgi:hypothetical protein
MRQTRITIKLTAVLAALVCAFAVSAASASAVTIEPLNTKFTGNSRSNVNWNASDGSWNCSKASLSGTTNATKTNYINVTPSFTGCKINEAWEVTYENTGCAKTGELSIPWKLTFAEGWKVTLQTNCSLVTKIPALACEMVAPPQKIEGAISWGKASPTSTEVIFRGAVFTYSKVTRSCEGLLLRATERALTGEFVLPGVLAH